MKVIVHCSATPDDKYYSAADIHRWHQNRGWSGIGYHYVIKRDGEIEAGRPEYWDGAHVKGHNKGTIGICLIGDKLFEKVQLESLFNLIEDIKHRHGSVAVHSHYEFNRNKTCPNFDAKAWYESQASL